MNWLTAYLNHVGIKQENGKWSLSTAELIEMERALGREFARAFNPSGTVLIPEHLAHTMIMEHLQKM